MNLKLPQGPPDITNLFPSEPLFLMERGMLLEILYLIHLYSTVGSNTVVIGPLNAAAVKWLREQVDVPIQHYNEYTDELGNVDLLISFVEVPTEVNSTHVVVPYNDRLEGIYYTVPYTNQILVKLQELNTSTDLISALSWHQQRREYLDWDHLAEKKILSLYPNTTVESLNKVAPIPADAMVSPLVLARACLNRDFDIIRQCLISEWLVIDDNLYRYQVTTFNFGQLLHNDSALIMRAAVGGSCLFVVRILLNEDKINPGAMDNLALRDALMSGKQKIAQLIASDKRVAAPKIYYAKSNWRLDQIIASGEVTDPLDESLVRVMDPISAQVVVDKSFRKYYKQSNEQLVESLGSDVGLVRDTHLHRALLLAYRYIKNKVLYDGLILYSNMRERQLKAKW